MTIAELDVEIHDLINKWSVYGAECICNALARSCEHHRYLSDKEYLIGLLSKSIDAVKLGDYELT